MILPKEHIMKQKIVTEFIDSSQFQPCGVDLTLKEVLSLDDAGKIDFDNKERKLSANTIIPFANDEVLLKRGAYKIKYNEYVSIPDDCAAFGYTRSSLLRCGAMVGCAVWDPGYHGRSESLLIVENQHGIILKKNAKVVQLVFVKLAEKATHLYSGQYKGENK